MRPEAIPPSVRDPSAANRACAGVAVLLVLFSFAAHVLAAGPLRGRLWGAHFYGFLPATTGVLAAAGLIAAVALLLAPWRFPFRAGAGFFKVSRTPANGFGVPLGIGAGFAVLCWLVRARHLLLGDGLPLTASVLEGVGFHPYEPLSAALQLRIYQALHSSLAAVDAPSWRVAWDALAIGSCVCGGLFAVMAWWLAPEIARRPGEPEALSDRGARRSAAVLLLTQGYVQVFCGYVENYSFLTLAFALYLLLALQHLRGRRPLAVPGVALLAALGLHMSALALAPSLALLVAWRLKSRGSGGAARDIGILLLACVVFVPALGWLAPGYRPAVVLVELVRGLLRDPVHGWGTDLAGHVLDVCNEQMLVGPMTALFAIAMFAVGRFLRIEVGRPAIFLGVAGSGWLAAQWVAGDSNLGYARNWDLLAPGGVVLTAAGISLLAEMVSGAWFVRILLMLSLASLHHTAPWIAVNASTERALRRFESLDLGGGRTESTLGFWHALNGDPVTAEAWLERSIAANPLNVRAHLFLARLYSETGRRDQAAAAFAAALRLRPDLDHVRRGLIDSLVRAGRLSEALAAAEAALAAHPASARYWAMKAIILSGLERRPEAVDAARRARASAPDSAAYGALLGRVMAGAPFDSLVANAWSPVAGIRQPHPEP